MWFTSPASLGRKSTFFSHDFISMNEGPEKGRFGSAILKTQKGTKLGLV